MTVGAAWYGDCNEVIDPTLVRPMELLDAGFPFRKRSLLTKHKSFIDTNLVRAQLELLGHPVDDLLHTPAWKPHRTAAALESPAPGGMFGDEEEMEELQTI